MFDNIVDRREEGCTVLRKTQLVEVYLLEIFDEICKKYGLRYFLVAGTLIGAMRHNGFIPWDDDIDVGMTKSEFDRLRKILPRELPEGVIFQDPRDATSASPFGKLRDGFSFFAENNTSLSVPHGIFIDIFPYDPMPNLPYSIVYFLVRWRAGSYRRWRALLFRNRRSVTMKFIDCFCAAFWKVVNFVGIAIWNALRIVAPAKGWHMTPEAEYPNRALDSQLFPVKYHQYEGREFPIPNDWEWVLKTQYQNWRELPPVEKREYHAKLVVPELRLRDK